MISLQTVGQLLLEHQTPSFGEAFIPDPRQTVVERRRWVTDRYIWIAKNLRNNKGLKNIKKNHHLK